MKSDGGSRFGACYGYTACCRRKQRLGAEFAFGSRARVWGGEWGVLGNDTNDFLTIHDTRIRWCRLISSYRRAVRDGNDNRVNFSRRSIRTGSMYRADGRVASPLRAKGALSAGVGRGRSSRRAVL